MPAFRCRTPWRNRLADGSLPGGRNRMGLWKKSGIHFEPQSLPRGIARLAIDGASLDEICDEVYRTLEPAMHRKVDRFRIWLLPTVDVKQLQDDRASGMLTWSDGAKEDFCEWELSSQRPTVPRTILDGGPSLQQELVAAQQGLEFGLTAGMRSLFWVPVRYAGELQALLLAATKNSLPRFPVDEMERVAARSLWRRFSPGNRESPGRGHHHSN